MNNLHPNASIGSFLPGVRELALVDANMELNGLIDHAIADLITEESLGEERNHVLRGLLIRVQALTNVMYATACSTDEELRHYLGAAYGKHHNFQQTVADEHSSEGARHD